MPRNGDGMMARSRSDERSSCTKSDADPSEHLVISHCVSQGVDSWFWAGMRRQLVNRPKIQLVLSSELHFCIEKRALEF